MLGKNAARAAPMSALAALSACSAARTSGRRTSSSAGRPAGKVFANVCASKARSPAAISRGQRLAHQQRERIAILRHAACLLRDVHFRFAPRGLGAMQIDLARHAGVEAQLGQVVGLALAVARLVRQRAATRGPRSRSARHWRLPTPAPAAPRCASPRAGSSPRAPRDAGCARGRTDRARTPKRRSPRSTCA